jgi:hypothetical protein
MSNIRKRKRLLVVDVRYLCTLIVVATLASSILTNGKRRTIKWSFVSSVKADAHSFTETEVFSSDDNNFRSNNKTKSLHASYIVVQQSPLAKSRILQKKPANFHAADSIPVQTAPKVYNVQEKRINDKRKKKTKKNSTPSLVPSSFPRLKPAPHAALTPPSYQTHLNQLIPTNKTTIPPTIRNDGYKTNVITRGGVVGLGSACNNKESIPNTVFQQVIKYQYVLNSQYWSDPIFTIDQIDAEVHHHLSKQFLDDCLFLNETKVFHTISITTTPSNDAIIYDTCTNLDKIPNSTCYVIKSSFRTDIFISDDRRRSLLQVYDRIADDDVVNEFTQALIQIFKEINLLPSGVIDVKFGNLTNYGPTPAPTTIGNSSKVVSTSQKQQKANVRRYRVRISLIVTITVLLFVLAMIIVYRRRKEIQRHLIRAKTSTNFKLISIDSIKIRFALLTKKAKEGAPIAAMYNAVLSTVRSDDKPTINNIPKSSGLDPIRVTEENSIGTLENRNEQIKHEKNIGSNSRHQRSDDYTEDDRQNKWEKKTSMDIRLYDGDESFTTGLGTNYDVNDDEILGYSDHSILLIAPTFVPVNDIISSETCDRMIVSIQNDFGRPKKNTPPPSVLRRHATYDDTVDL